MKAIWLPLLGKQRIQITILHGGQLRLVLDGAISLDERVLFRTVHSDGRRLTMGFDLGPATRQMLNRFRTSLRSAEYDAERDEAFFTVRPPLSPSVRVPLGRMHTGELALA